MIKLNCKIGLLLVISFLLTLFFRLLILILPYKVLASFMGVEGFETAYTISKKDLHRIIIIRWAVTLVSRYTPWKSLCMVQALTAQLLLRWLSISSTLYLGLSKSKDRLLAHAWLRSGSEIVTGGNNKENFRAIIFYGSTNADKGQNSGKIYN